MNTSTAQSAVLSESAADCGVFQPRSDLWVALRDAPSDYSHDEALLLCEALPGKWVSWVPGYGEITLSRDQFHQFHQIEQV